MKNLGRKTIIGFLIAFANFSVPKTAWSKIGGDMELMKDVQEIDGYSTNYNLKPNDTKGRIKDLISSYEKFIGRDLASSEKNFLTLELATVNTLPHFVMKGNIVEIYDQEVGSKEPILTVEIVDAEKNIFKFAGKTVQIDPDKPIHETIQMILKELEL